MASRDLSLAVPILANAAPLIIEEYDENPPIPGASLFVTCVSRTQQEQFILFKIGRRFAPAGFKAPVPSTEYVPDDQVTWQDWAAGKLKVAIVDKRKKVTTLDGWKKLSKHIVTDEEPLARAVDFGVLVGGKYLAGPKDTYLYHPLANMAHKHHLISGGVDFPGWEDWPHIETEGPFFVPKPV